SPVAATADHRRVLLRVGRVWVTTRATRVRDRRRSRWRTRRTAAAARMEARVSALPAAAARITGPSRAALRPPPPRALRRSRLGGRPGCGARHPAARRPPLGFHWGVATTGLAECGRQPAPAVADASYWSPSELDFSGEVRSPSPGHSRSEERRVGKEGRSKL